MNNYKVRTANMAKKSKKLNWWYAVPVVLVVAVTGYVIIILTRASDHYYSKTIDNNGLQGGTSTTSKNSGSGRARIVGETPVTVSYEAKEMSEAKKVCASINLSSNGAGKLTVESGSPIVSLTTGSQSTNFGTTYRAGSYNDICQDLDAVFVTVASNYGAKVTISQTGGEVKVKEVWVER